MITKKRPLRRAQRLTPIAALAVLAVASLLAFQSGVVQAATPENVPPAPAGFELDGDADNGELIYKQYCKKCHGKHGNGTGIMAADLDPKPADFTDKKRMAELSDWVLYLGIRDGGKPLGLSDQMTSWKSTLEDEEIHDVATFIRQFSEDG